MIRTIGFFGLAGGFVVASPALREGLGGAATQAVAYLNHHSPISYIAIALAALGIMAMLARSATSPR